MLFNLRTELWGGGGLNKIASTLRKHSLVDLGNIQYTHVQYNYGICKKSEDPIVECQCPFVFNLL